MPSNGDRIGMMRTSTTNLLNNLSVNSKFENDVNTYLVEDQFPTQSLLVNVVKPPVVIVVGWDPVAWVVVSGGSGIGNVRDEGLADLGSVLK